MAQLFTLHPDAVADEDREGLAMLLLKDVLHAPALEELLRRASRQAGSSWQAAEMLMMMLSATIHHPEQQINPTKAVYAVSEIFKGEKTWGGQLATVAQRTVWKAWSRFKVVAHLHAIRQIWLHEQEQAGSLDLRGLADFMAEDPLRFLADAESIRRAAVERRILSYEDAWRAPDDIDLPSSPIQIPPLPTTALEVLSRYVPEFSKDAGLDEA